MSALAIAGSKVTSSTYEGRPRARGERPGRPVRRRPGLTRRPATPRVRPGLHDHRPGDVAARARRQDVPGRSRGGVGVQRRAARPAARWPRTSPSSSQAAPSWSPAATRGSSRALAAEGGRGGPADVSSFPRRCPTASRSRWPRSRPRAHPPEAAALGSESTVASLVYRRGFRSIVVTTRSFGRRRSRTRRTTRSPGRRRAGASGATRVVLARVGWRARRSSQRAPAGAASPLGGAGRPAGDRGGRRHAPGAAARSRAHWRRTGCGARARSSPPMRRPPRPTTSAR